MQRLRTSGDSGTGLLACRTTLLAVILAAVSLGQSASQLQTEAVRRVGSRLACLCGCKSTVADCQMLECHYASPARKRIAELQAAGWSDDDIVADFVQKTGKQARPGVKGAAVEYAKVED